MQCADLLCGVFCKLCRAGQAMHLTSHCSALCCMSHLYSYFDVTFHTRMHSTVSTALPSPTLTSLTLYATFPTDCYGLLTCCKLVCCTGMLGKSDSR